MSFPRSCKVETRCAIESIYLMMSTGDEELHATLTRAAVPAEVEQRLKGHVRDRGRVGRTRARDQTRRNDFADLRDCGVAESCSSLDAFLVTASVVIPPCACKSACARRSATLPGGRSRPAECQSSPSPNPKRDGLRPASVLLADSPQHFRSKARDGAGPAGSRRLDVPC